MLFLKLQIKHVLKSWFTLTSLLAVLLCCFFFWKQNYRLRYTNQHLAQIQENLIIQKENIRYYKTKISSPYIPDEEKKELKKALKENKNEYQENKILLNGIRRKQWKVVYQILIKRRKYDIENAKRNNVSNNTLVILESDLQQMELLLRSDLPEENEHYSIKGGFFILEMMQEVLPPLTILAIIFVLTKLYSTGYFERMTLDSLLPTKNPILIKFYTGSIVSFSYFLIVFLLALFMPSLFFGFGNYNYPMKCMDPFKRKYIFKPMYQLFLPVLFLELLSFIFIAAAVLLIVQLLKNRLLALFTSVLLLVGGMLMPQYVIAIRNFAQYLPTTYFFALQPVNGLFGISNAYTFADENQLVTYPQVNFTNGIFVLTLGITIVMIFNYFFAKSGQKGRKTK